MKIENKKILVPAYLTNPINQIILQKNKTNVNFGTKVDNIHSLMSQEDYSGKSDTSYIFEVFNLLNNNKDSLTVLKEIVGNLNFINQMISFYKDCIHYEINIDDLPQDSEEEKDIKTIIKLIDSLDTRIKDNYNYLKKEIDKYEIVDDVYGQFKEHYLFKKAIEKYNKKYDISEAFKKCENLILKKATTRGKELDGVARYIVDNDLDSSEVQVVVNDEFYKNDISRIFKAYNIPFVRKGYHYDSTIVKKIENFINFLIKKDTESLLIVLRSKDNNDNFNIDFCDYIEHFEIKPENISKTFNRFEFVDYKNIKELDKQINEEKDPTNKEKLIEDKNKYLEQIKFFDIIDYSKTRPLIILENNAEIERKKQESTINGWLNNNPYDSLLDFYNNLIKKIDLKEYENDYSAIVKAGKIIVEAKNHNTPLQLLKEVIKTCQINEKANDSNDVIITDTDHLMLNKNTTIIVGANEGEFLPSLEMNQIIKEDYLKKIKNYPSLEERLDFLKLKLDFIKKISENLIISYCYSDYAGKEHKLSSYINDAFNVDENDFEEWPEEEFEYYKEKNYIVSKEKVKKLFIKDNNAISGSVSSLEQYQKCPYKYFLQKGIKLSDVDGYQDVDASILGNLRHKVYEILGKDNFNDDKLLEETIDEYMSEIKKVYDNQEDELTLKQKMIKDILKLNELVAKGLKNVNVFTDSKQEYRFKEEVEAGDYHFDFEAIVDRLDYDKDYYRVIDYKSSDVKLSSKEYDKGTQLQLLTYLWLLWKKKIIKGQPIGAYYFDLNKNPIENIKKILSSFEDEDLAMEEFIKANYIKGLTIPKSKTPLHDELKEKGYLQYTSGSLKDYRSQERKEEYDINSIDGIDKFLSQLYVQIANNIATGHFESKPDTNNCQYCLYSSICHKEEQEIEDNQEDENNEEE